MPGWVIAFFVVEVIQRRLFVLDIVKRTLGIGFEIYAVMEEFVIKQVIVFRFVQVIVVAHGGSWKSATLV